MTEMLFKYYGTDWGAMIATFLMIYYLGNKKRQGFLFGILASILWIAFNALVQSLPGILANIIFVFINLRSYIKWSATKTNES